VALEVRDLTVRRGATTVLEGYGFACAEGAILAILGANGVGKTTLLSCLVGILKPQAGSVALEGRVGFVPQLFDVAFDYSVLDIVLMGRARQIGLFGAPGLRDYAAARAALRRLGIGGLAERSFNTLSGGQRQLVMIAQALASECRILVLDEPCAALDYKNQAVVIAVLRSLATELGMTVVFSSHMPQHALEIATDVLLMRDARRWRHGPVEDVLTAANLSELYDIPIGRAHFAGHDAYTFAPIGGRP
jgi:iron complex transport system ATP-binding protein